MGFNGLTINDGLASKHLDVNIKQSSLTIKKGVKLEVRIGLTWFYMVCVCGLKGFNRFQHKKMEVFNHSFDMFFGERWGPGFRQPVYGNMLPQKHSQWHPQGRNDIRCVSFAPGILEKGHYEFASPEQNSNNQTRVPSCFWSTALQEALGRIGSG